MQTLKKYFWLLLFICTSINAQVDSLYVSTTVNVDIIAMDYNGSRIKLNNFIKTNAIKVHDQNESQVNIYLYALISEKQYEAIEKLFPDLGFVVTKKLDTESNYDKVKEIEHEIKYLKSKKASYTDFLEKLNEKSEKYTTIWQQIKEIDESIYNKEKELLLYNKKENIIKLVLNLSEENTTPNETKIAFVNMPGIEYAYLKIGSPNSAISSNAYQGFFVKYLFTRGKTFATAGEFKSINAHKTDTSQFTEMFLIGVGQDFYTRHLGRGKRKFLNLYSGYTAGGIIATNNTKRANIFFITPSVGVELFKNKYVLFDTKVSYFIPFQYNRNLTGISYSASFNFVF